MKILYIHQYFKIPENGGCIRSYHLAKGLIAAGHEVVMLTAHNHMEYIEEEVDGIQVKYLPVAYDNSFGFRKRLSSFFKFITASVKLAKKERYGYAYVMTTPLSTAVIALYLKWFRGLPYFFEVGDLWPEVPVKMGILKNPLIKQAAYFLEYLAYKNADRIVGLSPSISAYIKERHPDKKIATIPNISDLHFFQPAKKLHEGLKILYCGTIGVANHLEYLIAVAEASLAKELPIQFTIVGSGARQNAIEGMAKNLSNVTLVDFVNRAVLKEIIAEHDAFYVSFKDIDVLHTGSPNKYFDGLAAGKLMILNLGGWLKEVTEKHACGFSYDPDKPEEFIQKITPYINDLELLLQAQQHARTLSKQYSLETAQMKMNSFFP